MESTIELMRMTGNELRQICDLSKRDLSKDDLKDLFGISRGTLYNYFDLGEKSVPPEIEEVIDKHPILRDAKNKVIKNTSVSNTSEQKEVSFPGFDTLEKSIQLINETIKMVNGLIEVIKDDNDHIKKISNLHLSIIEKAYNAGDLVMKARK